MVIASLVKKGVYHDSVSLMKAAKELGGLPGISDSAVVMATKENKNILRSSGLYTKELDASGDDALVITVKSADRVSADRALKAAEEMLGRRNPAPASSDGAVK
ncbi:MAG TPA: hypothetical protein PL037_07685, partial [Elusimicrobiales bacterium]|nr:hypothetical protein [Elusimicrobiales bacterium]